MNTQFQITANGDLALGEIVSTGVFIRFEGLFDGATLSLMSSTDGGATFNKIRDLTSADQLRYDGAVGEVLKITTATATANTNVQVTLR